MAEWVFRPDADRLCSQLDQQEDRQHEGHWEKNPTSSPPQFFLRFLLWGSVDANIKVLSAENSELSQVSTVQPRVGQNIALCALTYW